MSDSVVAEAPSNLGVGVDAPVAEERPARANRVDLGEIDAVRGGWPFFRDRRIDAYAGLTRRFGND